MHMAAVFMANLGKSVVSTPWRVRENLHKVLLAGLMLTQFVAERVCLSVANAPLWGVCNLRLEHVAVKTHSFHTERALDAHYSSVIVEAVRFLRTSS